MYNTYTNALGVYVDKEQSRKILVAIKVKSLSTAGNLFHCLKIKEWLRIVVYAKSWREGLSFLNFIIVIVTPVKQTIPNSSLLRAACKSFTLSRIFWCFSYLLEYFVLTLNVQFDRDRI